MNNIHLNYKIKLGITFQTRAVDLSSTTTTSPSPWGFSLFSPSPHNSSNNALVPSHAACTPPTASPTSPPSTPPDSCAIEGGFFIANCSTSYCKFSIRWAFSRRWGSFGGYCSPCWFLQPCYSTIWFFVEGFLCDWICTIGVFEWLYLFFVGFNAIFAFRHNLVVLFLLFKQ